MNYRTVISFLGREQQKTWGKPSGPEWILIKGDADVRWTDEFVKIKQLSKNVDRAHFKGYGQTYGNDRMQFTNIKELEISPTYQDMEFYYNPDKDILFCMHKNSYRFKDKILEVAGGWLMDKKEIKDGVKYSEL